MPNIELTVDPSKLNQHLQAHEIIMAAIVRTLPDAAHQEILEDLRPVADGAPRDSHFANVLHGFLQVLDAQRRRTRPPETTD